MFQRSWGRSVEHLTGHILRLLAAIGLVLTVGRTATVVGQAQGAPLLAAVAPSPATNQSAPEQPPAAAARRAPALQLAQRRVQIRGFRNRIGPDGILAASESNLNYALFPSNRELVRRLEQAEKLITDERLADAFDVLDAILGETQDYFYQRNRDEPHHKSIKAEARRIISRLSTEAIAQYDLQFGATARQMLDKAVADGDADGVAAVVRRFFNTQAGFEAAWLLGRQHLDHGRALAAALTFEMLFDSPRARDRYEPGLSLTLATCWVRAGVPARAERVLSELRAKGTRPRIAQREAPFFGDDAGAIPWLVAHTGPPPEAAASQLTNWLFHRGNPARNAASSGGSPLLSTPRWQQTLANEIRPTAAGESMSRQLVDANNIDLPAETPLAIGDTAVVRTPRWVVGVNLRTGKRIWESPTWENDNYVARQTVINLFTGGPMTIVPHKLATRTTMASDGRAVFVVEDRGNQPFFFPGAVGRGASIALVGGYNKLLARELATEGKLLWEVGGENGEEEPQLAGVYFLGAPLVMGGQLYVIGELKGEITLFALDAASGKLDWSQPLATVETPVMLDSFRRLHGATPSFADGVMVCPTSAGAVVAVDVVNRSLLWGYQYPRNQVMNVNLARRTDEVADPFGSNRWRDGSVILASGRVVITPADSDFLHCINLVDGKDAWKPMPRGDSLYVGCVHGGTVLVVGRRQVHGLELIDGQPSWPAQPFGEEGSGVPSGRGFMSGGHYYQPLTSAEVVKINLADGTIKARVKSRKGYVLGNLVCNQGSVLSLNEDSLDCFFQLDEREQWAAETLRIRPDDPDALAMFGEILVDQGKLGEGLAQLERAYALTQTQRVRELLVESHLELLRSDFEGHRGRAGDIEKLLIAPVQKAEFARVMAVGLQKLGERMAAFEYYVKMCQPGKQTPELETVIAGELSVRRDRFVYAKIAELRAAASSEERRQMDERIAAHLIDLGGPTDLAALRQFVNYFGDYGPRGELQSRLVEQLTEQKMPLEAEWRLLRLARSANRAEAAAAWLRLAELMLRLDHPDAAASCYRTLAREFGDQQVSSSQTAKQVVESLPADSLARRYLAPARSWPKQVVHEEEAARSLTFSGVPLEVSFGREPFFEQLTVELESNRQELLVRDGYGQERFRAGLADIRRGAGSVNYSSVPWARATGHILLVQERTQILAIDALSPERNGKSRVLWRHDLADLIPDGGSIVTRSQSAANRRPRPQWQDQRGRPIGGIWPVGGELVCLQRGNKLLGIDVFSGEVVWTRHDVPAAEEIFGDDELLFVVAPNSSEATVLRAIDGAKVGTRPAPSSDRYLTYGHNVVSYASMNGKTLVRVADVWTGEESWRATFAANAKIEPVGSDEIAVMDSSGQLVVYSLRKAEVVIDTKLKADPALADLQVFRTADRYVVLAGRHVQYSQGNAHMYAVQNAGARMQPVIESRAYCFDRTTGKMSWDPKDLPITATLLNQPAHVPLLVFAMNVSDQSRASAQRVTTDVMCLDERTGGILYNKKLKNGSTTVSAVADPERHKLEIRCNSTTAILTFGEMKAEEKQAEQD